MRSGFIGSLAVIVLVLFNASVLIAGDPPVLKGTLLEDFLMHDGIRRGFVAYVPDGDGEARPLVLVLHGSRGTGRAVRRQSAYQFDALADRENFVVVYPDGYQKHWNGCRTAPKDAAHKMDIDDVGFVGTLIDSCCSRWHADPARVYAVGFSNGGHLCYRLAVESPERIAGIAAIAASMPASGWSKCPAPKRRVPLMIVNGTDDPINPFDGGMVTLFHVLKKGEVISSLESAEAWLCSEDLSRGPVVEQVKDSDPQDHTFIERRTWPGSQVCLYSIHGGGHTIPGGEQYLPEFLVGRISRDMNIAQEVFGFLAKSSRQ